MSEHGPPTLCKPYPLRPHHLFQHALGMAGNLLPVYRKEEIHIIYNMYSWKKYILPGWANWNKLIDNQWDFYDKFSKWPWLTHYKSVFISFFPLQSLLFVWIRSMVRIGLYRSLRFFPAWHTQDVRVPFHNHSVSLATHSILSQIPWKSSIPVSFFWS